MTRIQSSLETPIIGMMAIGKTKATRIPDIMMLAIWLKTESPPRCWELRVERGTIRLCDMLKIV